MARVQGTIVQLQITFDDDPPDVQVAVQQPADGPITVAKYSTGEIQKQAVAVYTYGIDTTPAEGFWEYEVASLGGITNVRKQRSFDVRPKIGP
jgi:hypothetical protein